MKKIVMTAAFGLVLALCAATLFASGGKNHGEVGQGEVIQHQECVDGKGTPSF